MQPAAPRCGQVAQVDRFVADVVEKDRRQSKAWAEREKQKALQARAEAQEKDEGTQKALSPEAGQQGGDERSGG